MCRFQEPPDFLILQIILDYFEFIDFFSIPYYGLEKNQ